MRRLILVCVSLCVLAGCGDDAGGGGDGGSGGGSSVGRGTAACKDWQDAICDFLDECGALARAQCDAQYQGVTCASDAAASACSNTFNSATCGPAALSGCDIADLVDPVPAQDACRNFIDHLCASGVSCGQYATDAECQADTTSSLDCSTVAVFRLSYETCLTEIDALSCTAAALPASCNEVFLRVQ